MNQSRIIPTSVHGVIDYLSAILLFLAPNLFGFADMDGPAVLIPRVLAVAILLMALSTNYELGLLKLIPMRTHLLVDVVASIFLAISPFLFGFSDEPANVWLPHVVVGVAYLIISLLTQTEPARRTTPIHE
jgi:hypothetical protein